MSAGHPIEPTSWVHGHSHEPNPVTPAGDGHFVVQTPVGDEISLTIADLAALPFTEVENCLIISTGHGTSGPFTFGGVLLADLLAHLLDAAVDAPAWRQVDVISADGFGTRLTPQYIADERPALLALWRDGQQLTREQGLVRLIVPSERDDALRQVKWVERIEVR